jgi:hypothetical protein
MYRKCMSCVIVSGASWRIARDLYQCSCSNLMQGLSVVAMLC